MLKSCIIFISLLAGCQSVPCQSYNFANQFNYKINAKQITPEGIQVDTSGQHIDLNKIDKIFDDTERCLKEQFGKPPVISSELAQSAQCLNKTFDLPIHRRCITIKIPSDWVMGCNGQELLPALAPENLCEAKGLKSDTNCPCRWRAGIEHNFTIVVTPDLYLLKDPLIRMVTSCNNPWVGKLAICAKP